MAGGSKNATGFNHAKPTNRNYHPIRPGARIADGYSRVTADSGKPYYSY